MASTQPAAAITSSSSASSSPGASAQGSHATLRPAGVGLSRESASESSDEGLRMSPASARRFARRNLRRTSATPDLVTSLVRPPSPDALYMAPGIHARLRHGSLPPRSFPVSSDLLTSRAVNASTHRRSGPLSPPHPSSLDIPKRHGGDYIFDMYALAYLSDPDPSLMCPICHDPLVDPVTTPCDHTFCYRCLRHSIASSPSGATCPIDRDLLSWLDCFTAARLIRTQINGLIVKCPHHARGCGRELRRELVEKHATTECQYRQLGCPDSNCGKTVRDKPKDNVCPHVNTSCPHCAAIIDGAELDAHFLTCPKAKTRCQGCWQLVCRSQLDAHHHLECDGVEVACPHHDVGCSVRVVREDMGIHTRLCSFHPDTPSGIVIRTQQELIQSYGDLGSQVREMAARQEEANRRIDELLASRCGEGALGDAFTHDKRTMQDLDAGFEEIHQNLTQLEARQSMWTMTQVMPIREEVTELRNNINMVRMHVNWLLNRSREEGRIRAANTGSSSASIRRDSSGEAAPVLPERRRSSGAETDLPRL